MLNDLKRLYSKLNRVPKTPDINTYGRFNARTYVRRFGGLAKALKKAGLEWKNAIPRRFTDEQLLNDLNRLYNKLKRIPTHGDIDKYGKYNNLTYFKRFGSLLTARKRAGLKEKIVPPVKLTDKELLDDLNCLFRKLNKIPTEDDIIKYGKYSNATYRSRFGSIKTARKKAGLNEKVAPAFKITEEELLLDLKRLHKRLKKVPSDSDIDKKGKYGSNTYRARFGSIIAARKKAGIRGNLKTHKKIRIEVKLTSKWKITDAELLNELKRLFLERKKIPSGIDINKYGKYDSRTYKKRFGSIMAARKKAGLDEKITVTPKITDTELLNDLNRLFAERRKIPSTGDIKKYGMYHGTTYKKRFGSIMAARKKAGLEGKLPGTRKISDKELLNDLKRLFKERKRTPSTGDIKKYGKYSGDVYRKRFGGLKTAREKAGLKGYIYRQLNYTDKELLNDLKHLFKKLKKIPSYGDIRKYGKYNEYAYTKRFGTLINALEKAGLDVKLTPLAMHTDAELLNDLKRLFKALKRTPSARDIKNYGKYSLDTYRKRFDSPVNARVLAGLPREIIPRSKITDKELLDDLKRVSSKLKKAPTLEDMENFGKYTYSPYRRRFGSHITALKKAGLA